VSLENISIRDKFWFHHTLRLRHETSGETMREILERVKNLLTRCPRVESGSVRVCFLGFGTSSLDIEIFAYVLASDWSAFLEVQEDLLLDVIGIAQAAGTGLAYPSQTLYLARFNTQDGNVPQHAATDPDAHLQSGGRHEAASGTGAGR
jgi:MscS family membrane protein